MRHAVLVLLVSTMLGGLGVALVEGCGAMAFELPPEEPLPEAAPPPRLLRRDAGTVEPARQVGQLGQLAQP